LAILGTPLVDLNKTEEENEPLPQFFENPEKFIKGRLDGCWCILAYDSIHDNFFAGTDYNNTIPIYYSIEPDGIYFSSHELPLARFLNAEIDPLGFSMAIQMKLTWGEHTRFKKIKKLLPCQIMTFSGSKEISCNQYWHPAEESPWKERFDDIVEHWLDILKISVNSYHKHSKKKSVLCELTGGEDSRLILSAVHNLNIPFSAVVDGNEPDLDVIIARNIAHKGNFPLIIRAKSPLPEEMLLRNATDICLMYEAYEDFSSPALAI